MSYKTVLPHFDRWFWPGFCLINYGMKNTGMNGFLVSLIQFNALEEEMIFRKTPCLSLRRFRFEKLNRPDMNGYSISACWGIFIQTNKGELV